MLYYCSHIKINSKWDFKFCSIFTFSILRCKELKSMGTRATGFSWKAAPSFVAYLNTEPSLHFPYFEPFPTFGEIVSLPFKYSSVIRKYMHC